MQEMLECNLKQISLAQAMFKSVDQCKTHKDYMNTHRMRMKHR